LENDTRFFGIPAGSSGVAVPTTVNSSGFFCCPFGSVSLSNHPSASSQTFSFFSSETGDSNDEHHHRYHRKHGSARFFS
jgi:hypothetical protein